MSALRWLRELVRRRSLIERLADEGRALIHAEALHLERLMGGDA